MRTVCTAVSAAPCLRHTNSCTNLSSLEATAQTGECSSCRNSGWVSYPTESCAASKDNSSPRCLPVATTCRTASMSSLAVPTICTYCSAVRLSHSPWLVNRYLHPAFQHISATDKQTSHTTAVPEIWFKYVSLQITTRFSAAMQTSVSHCLEI